MAPPSNNFENSRTGWASLNWKEAQSKLMTMLSQFEFMRFEELRLGGSKRADLVVVRNTDDEVIFGVLEVKSFKKISNSIKTKAISQVCGYLNSIYKLTNDSSRYGKKKKSYFATVVFTVDYPTSTEMIINEIHTSNLIEELINCEAQLFITTPENLLDNLKNRNLLGLNQTSLEKFY